MNKILLEPKRIKRMVRILATLIIIILLSQTKVSAGAKDSTLVRNTQSDILAVAPLSDRIHLYYLELYTINGIPSYCIELGKSITSTTYNSTLVESEQLNITKLTKQQLDHIKVISHFGYQYKKDGVIINNSREYYMATQELIWEYLNNIDITWTTELDVNGKKINIEPQKNMLKTIINLYEKELSIPNIINCKPGDTITFKDDSLSFYELKNKGNQEVSLNNNELTIKVSNNFIGNSIIELKTKEEEKQETKVYNIDDSQVLLSKGKINGKTKTITLNVTGYNLTTNLVDKDTKTNKPSGEASLIGAEYELYNKDNQLVTSFTTDETLINSINNLYNDKYYIKQTKASPGYKINDEIIEVDLSKTSSITLEEEVIKNTIEINKLYEVNNTYQREENIKFNIFDNNNNLYSSLTTTKTGLNSIILPYGKYTIIQENTTYGYNKVNNIKIIIDENSNTTIRYDLVDTKIISKIKINTKDKQTKKSIKEQNIKYKIKEKSTGNYLLYLNKDVFSTDESGELIFPMSLPYGEYIIEQITPPTNYLENEEFIEIKIDENSEYVYINGEIVINADYLNELKKEKSIIKNTSQNLEKVQKNEYEKIKIPNTLKNSYNFKLLLTIPFIIGVIYKKFKKTNIN